MELKNYIAPLLKWWWLVLATTLVAVASSVFAVSQQPSTYQARSSILIGQAMNNPNPNGMEFFLTQQLGQTYVDIAKREPVRQATMATLGLTWLPGYEARMVPNTQVIELLVTDTEPRRAMVVANELANQVVLSSPANARDEAGAERESFIQNRLDRLEEQIDTTDAELEAKQSELGDLVSARQIADTQAQVAALQTKLNTLEANYASLLASSQQGALNALEVFEVATVPVTPVGPNRLATVLTAAAIGFLIGAGAAYFLEYLDDSIKSPEDVENAVGLPALAAIARHTYDRDAGDSLITRKSPRSAVAEAYRGLRTAVLFSDVDHPTRSLMVTSSREKEGKSLTVANLATVLAQAGNKVLLVDVDMRRPTQHRIFKIPRNFGLTNYLVQMPSPGETVAGQTADELLEEFVRETEQEGLYLLSSGPLPPNPSEIMGSVKMAAFTKMAAERYDYVVYDTPPILAVTDAVVLATRVDTTIVVCDTGKTRRAELRRAVERLQEVGAHVGGIVLNRLTAKAGEYYYYYGYDSNGYHHDDSIDGDIGKSEKRRKKSKSQAPPAEEQKAPGLLTRLRRPSS